MIFSRYQDNLRIASIAATYVACLLYSAQVFAAGQDKFYDIPLPFLNVPLTVLATAFAGTLVGMAYTPAVESRKRLYIIVMANTLLSAWAVVLLPEWREWTISPVALPPFAGVLAAVNCFVAPALFKRLPSAAGEFVDRIFNRRGSPPPGSQQ